VNVEGTKEYNGRTYTLLNVIGSTTIAEGKYLADPATGRVSFGVGLGTIILALNVVLLSGYALGCHSLRHLAGGALDEVSRVPPCLTAYRCVSVLNRRHLTWAWLSLFSVAFSDLYVRLLSMGVWSDPRLL